jgi:hypothetical protein
VRKCGEKLVPYPRSALRVGTRLTLPVDRLQRRYRAFELRGDEAQELGIGRIQANSRIGPLDEDSAKVRIMA